METKKEKHWSKVELLHHMVKNPNIHIKGKHSYYSDAWTGSFEETVVRYLYGDEFSLNNWTPQWEVDQLYIGAAVPVTYSTVRQYCIPTILFRKLFCYFIFNLKLNDRMSKDVTNKKIFVCSWVDHCSS
ncbi:hypothetical protein TUM19329_07940 [Legionella antarctica]|uniref:Uncharacterized protein n=1 Tax=Legionella antarctica TaxID=2708020 RepID=A0A6F8T2I1_9GAMM|nr:hypothetical protein [Legionella antarctica]BCA94433.1 hypothetical protein TUM19329_07940 [Legionella antarctica]